VEKIFSSVSSGDKFTNDSFWFKGLDGNHACGSQSRNLRDKQSASATFGRLFFYIVGATGTGSTATSPARGATGPSFVATSGAFAGRAAAQGERGSCNQTSDTKACQDLF
jgi:hypothetical protein